MSLSRTSTRISTTKSTTLFTRSMSSKIKRSWRTRFLQRRWWLPRKVVRGSCTQDWEVPHLLETITRKLVEQWKTLILFLRKVEKCRLANPQVTSNLKVKLPRKIWITNLQLTPKTHRWTKPWKVNFFKVKWLSLKILTFLWQAETLSKWTRLIKRVRKNKSWSLTMSREKTCTKCQLSSMASKTTR